jgi:hypothetical protein
MDAAKMTEAEIEATLQELAAEQEAVRERRVALKAVLDEKIHARNAAAVLNSVSPEVRHAIVRVAPLGVKAEAPRPQPTTTQPQPAPVAPQPAAATAAPQPAATNPAVPPVRK